MCAGCVNDRSMIGPDWSVSLQENQMSKEKVELSKSEPHGPTLPRDLHPVVGISGDGWKNKPESVRAL